MPVSYDRQSSIVIGESATSPRRSLPIRFSNVSRNLPVTPEEKMQAVANFVDNIPAQPEAGTNHSQSPVLLNNCAAQAETNQNGNSFDQALITVMSTTESFKSFLVQHNEMRVEFGKAMRRMAIAGTTLDCNTGYVNSLVEHNQSLMDEFDQLCIDLNVYEELKDHLASRDELMDDSQESVPAVPASVVSRACTFASDSVQVSETTVNARLRTLDE